MQNRILKAVFLLTMLFAGMMNATMCWSQNMAVMDQLKEDPRRGYGNDYPYRHTDDVKLTKTPKGYKAFYISHYARHGSRYYWNAFMYKEIDSLLKVAHEKHLLTAEGEAFREKFIAAKDELQAGVSELSDLGWQQHQGIARTMYNNFTEVFEKGGNVMAISSLSGRCVLSMSAFCQELVQCNPKLEIREQSSRKTLDLRFGHDTCLGPLTVLMGINGADKDPEDPNEVKYYYQNWETCKASNIQLIFYAPRKALNARHTAINSSDVLVKCLLNGEEATLPVPTECSPYYKWSDFRNYYLNAIISFKSRSK